MISFFVLDSSMTMAWFFQDEATPQTRAVLRRLEQEEAVVPSLWPLEVANVARVNEKRGRVTPEESEDFFDNLRALPIRVEEDTPHRAWGEIMRLSREQKLTPYDAAYLELALRLGLPLATLDKELRQAALNLSVTLL